MELVFLSVQLPYKKLFQERITIEEALFFLYYSQ